MNSFEFFNNKKVWRPQFSNSLPIIDVVTHYKRKSYPKEEYLLKIKNIEMHNKPESDFVENFSKISSIREKSNIQFVEWTNRQHVHDDGKNINENYINISTFRQQIKNEVTFEEKFPKQVITVKKERKIARKVYLKWSKYSSSVRDDESNIKLDMSEINRKNTLRKKYWNLWRQKLHKKKSSSPEIHIIKKISNNPTKTIERGNSEDNLICSNKSKAVNIHKRSSEQDTMRNKANKSLLEKQQRKIQEQENMIKELQLARIKLEEEKGAFERQILFKNTSEGFDQKLRGKTKFLSMCNLPNKVDASKYKNSWEFVTKMELRAEERKKRWEMIKERKQKLEEERLEKLRIEEERKKRIEEEERKNKILQMKLEKQRQDKLRKKQEEERLYLNALNLKAKDHYNDRLREVTFKAFKHLLEMKNFMMKEAERYYNGKIMLYYFTIWKLFYKIQSQRREGRAHSFYENLLIQKGFASFKQIYILYIDKHQKAIEFNEARIQRNYFFQWQIFVHKQKHETMKKEKWATNFYEKKLLQRCLWCWLKLPHIFLQEREKEQRMRRWYDKVQELLPDFQSSSEFL